MRTDRGLFYGDNLEVLREHIDTASIDLVYLDPPFNSNANYNLVFKSPTGDSSNAQLEAFEDTWHWNDCAEAAFDAVEHCGKGWRQRRCAMIRDLHSTIERERAPIGVFLTKAPPTSAMQREAAAVGRFHAAATGKTYPRLQIITLAELFQGRRPDIPFVDPTAAFRRAGREATEAQPSPL